MTAIKQQTFEVSSLIEQLEIESKFLMDSAIIFSGDIKAYQEAFLSVCSIFKKNTTILSQEFEKLERIILDTENI